MNLQTKIPLSKVANQIEYGSQLLLLGSCFVENIGAKFSYFKFQSVQNPLGILFNPLAIEKLVCKALSGFEYTEADIFYLNEKWQCYDAHSNLSNTSKELLIANLNERLEATKNQIEKASHIILTLGTAWVYHLKENGNSVANCHKVPQKEFDKKLLSTDAIRKSLLASIEVLKKANPTIKIILTLSPVRHIKDGFVENQQSKAHLLTAIHDVVDESGVLYFPSYEILMDELRDYRFYATDMVHPNQLAIDYIWERFKEVWIAEKTLAVMEKVDTVQKGLMHRPFNPESEQHHKFVINLNRKIAYLKAEYDFMKFKK